MFPPTSCDSSVKRLMSQICMRGLVGDSSITNRVRPGLSACLRALHRCSSLVNCMAFQSPRCPSLPLLLTSPAATQQPTKGLQELSPAGYPSMASLAFARPENSNPANGLQTLIAAPRLPVLTRKCS